MNAKNQRLVFAVLMLVLFAVWAVMVGAQPTANTPVLATTITPVFGDEDARIEAMLTVFDPWNMVLSSDSPAFVAYKTGQVIYRSGEADDKYSGYMTVTLDEDELADLLSEISVGAIAELPDYFDLAPMTDQPTQTFTVPSDFGGWTDVTVYGSLDHDADVREAAPDILVNAFDVMMNYSHEDAEPWTPEKIEVIVWPYDTSDAVDWPADWPNLGDVLAVPRESVTSIYIDYAELDALRELMDDASAVRLNDGETYTLTTRIPFPHEVIIWPMGGSGDATAEATDVANS